MTSRSESRSRDNKKIDLINQDELENGSLPIQVQCKSLAKGTNYTKILRSMPPGKNVILHKYTEKSQKGLFITKGEYAIMDMDFFIELLEHWQSE